MPTPYTIANDLKRAAAQLDEDAQTHKNSYYNSRWGWDVERQAEYNELRRVAKRMREIARVFKTAKVIKTKGKSK